MIIHQACQSIVWVTNANLHHATFPSRVEKSSTCVGGRIDGGDPPPTINRLSRCSVVYVTLVSGQWTPCTHQRTLVSGQSTRSIPSTFFFFFGGGVPIHHRIPIDLFVAGPCRHGTTKDLVRPTLVRSLYCRTSFNCCSHAFFRLCMLPPAIFMYGNVIYGNGRCVCMWGRVGDMFKDRPCALVARKSIVQLLSGCLPP